MITTVEEYLELLKKQLEGCDPATVRDALSDAEEYLRNGLDAARNNPADFNEGDALGEDH